VTVLLRVVELEFTSPANGAPLSVCVGGSANLTVQVRVGDLKPPSAGTVTWQPSSGLPGTCSSPTQLQALGGSETTFTSNGSLTSGAGTITAEAKGLKDAAGKPMPDVSATLPGYVVKVTGITPAPPVCALGGEVELTAVLDPPNVPAPSSMTWSLKTVGSGRLTVGGGAVKTTFINNLCMPDASLPTIQVDCGASKTSVVVQYSAAGLEWKRVVFDDCKEGTAGPKDLKPEFCSIW
jgi:hypothetical protein